MRHKPKTRRFNLTVKLRNHLRGEMARGRFQVYLCHSKFIWWKFYEDH